MTDLLTALDMMDARQREGALLVLDQLSRPLTAREIERSLRNHGVPRSRAVVMAASVCKLAIVAVVGGEQP